MLEFICACEDLEDPDGVIEAKKCKSSGLDLGDWVHCGKWKEVVIKNARKTISG